MGALHFLSSPMDLMILILLLLTFSPSTIQARPLKHTTQITVAGVVYCDSCSNNGLSRHSYFLPGVDVNIRCKFKSISPKTAEQVTFSVNRTTDKYGVYKLQIPSIDGVDCVDGLSIESLCQASLLRSSSPSCDVPVLKTTTHEISAKSKQDNICLYSLNAMSYRPSERNVTLCANQNEELAMAVSFNSSKFFLPYFPPYGFFWPPLPLFPFPPMPSFPFPPLPPLPFPPLPPFPSLPPFPYLPFPPFPFPSAPPFPPIPFVSAPPPPPAFDLRDPRTWIPNLPPFSLPSPPPPPAFSLTDPRTWTPYIPIPSPPNSRQEDQNP